MVSEQPGTTDAGASAIVRSTDDASTAASAASPVPSPSPGTVPAVGPSTPKPQPPVERAAAHSVAATASRLAALDDAELTDHPAIYQEIHRDLQGALADIDGA